MRQGCAQSGRLVTVLLAAGCLVGGTQADDGSGAGGERAVRNDPVRVVQKGTSTRAARQDALNSLPLERLTPENRARADEVLRSVGLFRELPTLSVEIEPEAYRFFIAHPDVAVSIWRALGISTFEMWQTGPNEYEADAGDGTCGTIDALLRGDDHNLILCEGLFTHPLLARPIRAKALIHLETTLTEAPDGRTWARHRAALFVSLPSQTAETMARLTSPVGNLVLDRNFREVSLFVHMMSLAMRRQPGWVERLAGRLEGILELRRTQLLRLSARVYVAARKRELARQGQQDDITLDDVLAPLRTE